MFRDIWNLDKSRIPIYIYIMLSSKCQLNLFGIFLGVVTAAKAMFAWDISARESGPSGDLAQDKWTLKKSLIDLIERICSITHQ